VHVATFPGPEIISRLSPEFVHDVDNLPDPGLKEFLARNGLIERQRASDGCLFRYSANLPDSRL